MRRRKGNACPGLKSHRCSEKGIDEDAPRTRFLERSRANKFEPRRPKQCRIFVSLVEQQIASSSPPPLPPPYTLPFSPCLSRGTLFLPQGVADKAVADRNLPIRFYLPHCAPVFSPAPFLSVSYPFTLCPSLHSGLGRVKILAWGRPVGRSVCTR